MTDKFDIVNLYKYYSKGILKENRNIVSEKEVIRKFSPGEFKKFKAILYYDDDPKMIPDSFQVDYYCQIIFDNKKIRSNFSSEIIDFGDEVNVDDDAIEKMIDKKMSGKLDKKVKTATVDVESFYHDFFRKNLTSYVVENKLNNLIRAGVLPIEDWKVYAVTYSTQVDEKLLFKKIETELRRGKPFTPANYGYQIAFTSTNRMKKHSLPEVMEFVKEFSKALETSIFKDTEYYKIVKK